MTTRETIEDRVGLPNGLVKDATHIPSPNCDDRPNNVAVELLIVHNISLPPGVFGTDDVEALFTNRLDTQAHAFFETLNGLRVSAHFFIRRDGRLIQFVPCHRRAWHAGESRWRGRVGCNDFSIGVELEGVDDLPYTDAQYDRLARLTVLLEAHYPIIERTGHSDVAPGRKTDPGPAFDWPRYACLTDRLMAAAENTGASPDRGVAAP